MTTKSAHQNALGEVVHVLNDIEKDLTHAADHSTERDEAVSHLREADVELPRSLTIFHKMPV